MENKKTIYLTEEGMQEMEEELQFLKTKERARVAESIAEAREKGDLSENAEYDAAKEEQGHLEARIAQLEDKLSRARLVDESQIDSSKAYIHSNVRVLNKANGKEQTYQLVAEEEANVREGKISISSPVGKGLLGGEVGDEVDIEVPAGTVTFEILNISR